MATDNAANFVAAVKLTLNDDVTEEHIRRSCHTLQLSIRASLRFVTIEALLAAHDLNFIDRNQNLWLILYTGSMRLLLQYPAQPS